MTATAQEPRDAQTLTREALSRYEEMRDLNTEGYTVESGLGMNLRREIQQWEITHDGQRYPMQQRRTEMQRAAQRTHGLASVLVQVESKLREQEQAYERWWNGIKSEAVQAAQEHDWCGEFERALGELEIEDLQRTTTLSWWADAHIEVPMDVNRYLTEVLGINTSGLQDPDYDEVFPAEVKVVVRVAGQIEGPVDTCLCDNVSDEEIRDLLPEWARDYEYELEHTYCDHCG